MRITFLGQPDPVRYAAVAAFQTGAVVNVITWAPAANAGSLIAFAEFPITLHVIEQTGEHFQLSRAQFNQAMQHAMSESDLVVLLPGAWSAVEAATWRWMQSELGTHLAAVVSLETVQAGPADWPEMLFVVEATKPADPDHSSLAMSRAAAERGANEVIWLGPTGPNFVFDADGNDGFDIPTYPLKGQADHGSPETGVGAYLTERLRTDNPFRAGKFARLAVALKYRAEGPLQETAERIGQLLDEIENPGVSG